MARQQSSPRSRTALYLAAALVAAAITAAVVAQVVKAYQKQLESQAARPQTVETVVAVRDLYMGIPITQEDVALRQLAPEMVPAESAFQSVDEVVGRTPRERILANELLRTERLARRDAGIGLNAIVTPGKRAMAIEVNTESGVAGFLQPNNFVDVIVTIKPDDDAVDAKWVTETILQGIKVLAVDSNLGNNEEQEKKNRTQRLRPSVTLEVTLEEAEKLALASSKGELHLVLRSDVDITQVEDHGPMVINNIIGLDPVEETKPTTVRRLRNTKPAEAGPADTVEVIQGADRTTEKFDEQGNKIEDKNKRR
ncbi:Flp pilus assembly protein CpaB [Myxococcota bacterium]|nr:Flp pilus assembly protein CpaB [Myxococcota bacterium]